MMISILVTPTNKAGRHAAKKSFVMERLATVANTMIVMDGGIRIPVPEAAAMMADDHSLRYPALVMEGNMAELMAAASAFTEPLRPEKIMVDPTALTPRPPGTLPTRRFTKSTKRVAAPDRLQAQLRPLRRLPPHTTQSSPPAHSPSRPG